MSASMIFFDILALTIINPSFSTDVNTPPSEFRYSVGLTSKYIEFEDTNGGKYDANLHGIDANIRYYIIEGIGFFTGIGGRYLSDDGDLNTINKTAYITAGLDLIYMGVYSYYSKDIYKNYIVDEIRGHEKGFFGYIGFKHATLHFGISDFDHEVYSGKTYTSKLQFSF